MPRNSRWASWVVDSTVVDELLSLLLRTDSGVVDAKSSSNIRDARAIFSFAKLEVEVSTDVLCMSKFGNVLVLSSDTNPKCNEWSVVESWLNDEFESNWSTGKVKQLPTNTTNKNERAEMNEVIINTV